MQNGSVIGVTGESKRMEAYKITIGSGYGDLGVRYTSFVENKGWQSYVTSGQPSGTTGQSKAIQAVKIELTGTQANNYDIYYRAHVQTYGWLGWAKNGASAGTSGYSKRIEGIQIKLVAKGGAAPGSTSGAFLEKPKVQNIVYQAHMQTSGWNAAVMNGTTGGVTGKSKRMEALKISLENPLYSGGVQYRAHVQTYGWQGWKSNGAIAGTTGLSKRMEAVQIQLTGEMAKKYDIYYRVHVQTYGWLGWTKNGAKAGTEGMSKRMEAVQIQLVEKGTAGPSGGGAAFRTK